MQSVIGVFRMGCAVGWMWSKSAIPVVGSTLLLLLLTVTIFSYFCMSSILAY